MDSPVYESRSSVRTERPVRSALINYESMETVARRHKDRAVNFSPYMLRANIHGTATTVFDPAQAQHFAKTGLDLAAGTRRRAAEARALWNLLVLNRYAENTVNAIEYGEQALALARALRLHEQMAFIMTDLGAVYMATGRGASELSPVRSACVVAHYRQRADLADNLMLSGVQALVSGDFGQVDLFTEEGAQIRAQIGNAMGQASNEGTQAQAWFERGHITEALQIGTHVKHLAEQTHIQFMMLQACSTLARMYAGLGALAQAQELAQIASAPTDQAIPGFFRSWGFSVLAKVYIVCGDLRAAEQAVMTSKLDQTGNPGASPGLNLAEIADAELGIAKGEYDRVVKRMREFAEILRQAGIRFFLTEMLYLQAVALPR